MILVTFVKLLNEQNNEEVSEWINEWITKDEQMLYKQMNEWTTYVLGRS